MPRKPPKPKDGTTVFTKTGGKGGTVTTPRGDGSILAAAQKRKDLQKAINAGHPRGWINPNPPQVVWNEEKQAWYHGTLDYPVCGAQRSGKSSSGKGQCASPAGQGTDHLGYGSCWRHFGNGPTKVNYAIKAQIRDLWPEFGLKVDTDPHTAVLDELRRSAGMVEWLEAVIKYLGHDPNSDTSPDDSIGMDRTLHQFTNMGIKPSVWWDMLLTERKHMVMVARNCADMGIAERQVQLAEDQGKLIAFVIRNFIMDARLGLTPEQQSKVPALLREHLMAIPSGAIETTGEPT